MNADRTKTIFLIDDDKLTNFVNKRIMERTGLNVNIQVFDSGINALSAIKQLVATDFTSLPDVILLDVNMPGITGWEFLEEYDKLVAGAGSKIYMLTASLSDEDKATADQYHMVTGFIQKPLKSELLYGILEAMVMAA